MSNWMMFEILLVTLSNLMFCEGLMLMDYGATFKNIGFVGESLVFKNIEPRVIYHTGLVMCLVSYLMLVILSAWELSKY
jgi:hypothetical protein